VELRRRGCEESRSAANASTSRTCSCPTLHHLMLRQAKEAEKQHGTKGSKPADGAAKAAPSGAKHADRDAAKKADGKASAAKHSADARPQKASAGAKKDSATAAKANGKEEKANGRVAVKKERKVFELPGQTRDTPPEVSLCSLPPAPHLTAAGCAPVLVFGQSGRPASCGVLCRQCLTSCHCIMSAL